MVKRIVIDDRRVFNFKAKHVTSGLRGCFELINGSSWDELYLDNDLGGEFGFQGYDVARWLESCNANGYPIAIGKVYIVSSNPVASMRIKATLDPIYSVEKLSQTQVTLLLKRVRPL